MSVRSDNRVSQLTALPTASSDSHGRSGTERTYEDGGHLAMNPATNASRAGGLNESAQEYIRDRAILDQNGCWIWQLVLDRCGYGRSHIGGKNAMAHRASYEAFVGPIPSGLTVDHLCRMRACVNPAHLEAVTQGENTARAPLARPTLNSGKSACPQGHAYTPSNTYRWSGDGGRQCRTCNRERGRRNRARARLARHVSGA